MFGRFGRSAHRESGRMAKEFKRLAKQRRYGEALRLGREYIKEVPGNHDVLFTMGAMHYAKGQLRESIRYLDMALEIGQYDVEALLLKAHSHSRLGQPKRAAACCKKIQEVDPRHREACRLLEALGSDL